MYNIGCLGHDGTVTAAHEWDSPPLKMKVNPSLPESVENVLHRHLPNEKALLVFKRLIEDEDGQLVKKETDKELNKMLSVPRLERFIGVVYRVRFQLPHTVSLRRNVGVITLPRNCPNNLMQSYGWIEQGQSSLSMLFLKKRPKMFWVLRFFCSKDLHEIGSKRR